MLESVGFVILFPSQFMIDNSDNKNEILFEFLEIFGNRNLVGLEF